MSSTPRKSAELFVEPLEARIAPTGLVAITNPFPNTDPNSAVGKGDPRYIDYTVAPSSGKLGFVPGSNFGVAGGDIFALKLTGDGTLDPTTGLSSGDSLSIYNTVLGFNLANPFIQTTNGTVIAFFQDANHDNLVQTNELVGIAMSKNASLNVNGTVHGDIVDNLSGGGVIKFTGAIKTNQTIGGISVVGDVTGSILAGGAINNINVSGNVGSILAGTAAGGATFHFGDPGVATGTLNVPLPKAGFAGPSITGVNVASIGNVIRAGDGGIFGDGGSIVHTVIQNDIDGFSILSGNGGDGNASGAAGKGGAVGDLVAKGVIDATGAQGLISIQTGHGGTNGDFKGGKGGPINGVAISYESLDTASATGSLSVDFLNDRVLLKAGDGGIGLRGGKGGVINDALVATATASDGDPNNPETQILSGNGGVSTIADTGFGGRAGDMTAILAENFLVPLASAVNPVVPGSILVQGGTGGAGKPGGSVNAVTLLGTHLTVNAGNGSDGFGRGGSGGSVNTVSILNLFDLFATDVTINAGSGGVGFDGNGGNGGDVTAVRILDSHLNTLTINSGTHANGGTSNNGVGGTGGSVNDFIVNDSGDFRAQAAPVVIRTGNGGDGTIGGGDGGAMGNGTTSIQIIGTDLAYRLTAGSGGSVTGGGSGDAGRGGGIVGVGLADQPVTVTNVVLPTGILTVQTQISSGDTATVISGTGGTAADGLGGVGGDVVNVNVVTSVNLTPNPDLNQIPTGFQPDNQVITAGSGGSGGAGAGQGGEIASSAAVSLFGSVTAHAGDAGTDGGVAAPGGSVNQFVTAGLGSISLLAGNGGAGGMGGSVANTVTNLTPITIPADAFGDPAVIEMTNNRGGLTVRAGNGSVGGGGAGAGGAVTNFSGFVSNGGLTSITGGTGGSSGGKLSGAGGDVSLVTLTGVNASFRTGSFPLSSNGSTVTIDAGDAGVAAKSKHGADGGSVSNITIFSVDPGTLVQHVAAGDAGSGKLSGGTGGSVSTVHVGLPTEAVDIGYRSGRNFGYDVVTGAGGIFAGLGGQSSAGVVGASGNVTDVTAAAIASIVAGKSGVRLAGTVDMIYLDGEGVSGVVPTVAAADGSFTNFGTANLVGSVPDPAAVGASVFRVNVDGLIAAVNLTGNRDFQPEAFMTLVNNQLVVADLQQPNPNPVIISL